MHWRVKGFLYWLVALGAYVVGWQVFEVLEDLALNPTVALAVGIISGFVVLGVAAVVIFKVRQALGIRSRSRRPDSGDGSILNDRQQRLMEALQQAVQAQGDAVIHTGDGKTPEYKVEVTAQDKEEFSNP